MEAIVAGPARREQLTAEIMERTGIDEALIERLVHGFYARVRADAVLGPIFEARTRIGSRISPGCARSGPRSR
jgi:hemoglobin